MFDRLDQQANYVNTHVEQTAEKIYTSLDNRASELGTTIEGTALRVFDSIDAATNAVNARLEEMSAGVSSQMRKDGGGGTGTPFPRRGGGSRGPPAASAPLSATASRHRRAAQRSSQSQSRPFARFAGVRGSRR